MIEIINGYYIFPGMGTPVLGGDRNLSDRRETLRALYERKKSKVQTLDYRKVSSINI